MPLYQFKCQKCGTEFERVCTVKDRVFQNCECGGWTRVVPAVHGPNCSNDSASWLPSVLEVVQKDSDKPHVQAFLKDPTRANYKAWMKGEGIRPLENGERHEKPKLDIDRHTALIMNEKVRRERYEVRG
jgi:putative FmdB family regulatory protein